MTVPNSNIKVTYNGNGVAKEFQIPFSFLEKEHIKVIRIDLNGGEHLLTKDYFVDSTANVVHYPGYPIGEEPPQAEQPQVLPNGEKLLLYRSTPKTQDTDLPRQGILSEIEAMDDKSIMCIQEMNEELGRSIKPPISSNLTGEIPAPVIPGASLAISEDGKSLRLGANPDGIAQSVATANEAKQTANGAKQTADGIADTATQALSNSQNAQDRVAALEELVEELDIGDAETLQGSTKEEILQTAQTQTDTTITNLGITPFGSAGEALVVTADGTGTEWKAVSGVPVGTIMAWGGLTAPAGYLECAGQVVKRAIYKDLFQAIGTVWGTTAGDDFKLPDFKSAARFLRSRGDGLEVGTVQGDAFQGHYHEGGAGDGYDKTEASAAPIPNAAGGHPSRTNGWKPKNDGINGVPRTADETRPKNAVVMYCIKATDEYINPSQVDIEPIIQQLVNKPNREEIKELAGTRLWLSGEYTPIAKQPTIVLHGLDIDPLKCKWELLLICKVAEFGYSVGDLAIGACTYGQASGQWIAHPLTPLLSKNDIRFDTTNTTLFVINKSTSAGAAMATLANWRYIFRIWY